jgi:nucleotide-binding universal stress UspA family protein
MKTNNVILVPTDFTNVAECAINHACVIAKHSQNQVLLLHVFNKESKAELKKTGEQFDSLSTTLKQQCDYYGSKYNVQVDYLIKEGSIFTEIAYVADEVGAELIVMGTHGVVGMQKLTGAFAIKVIESSKVPVIVVKSKMPNIDGYKLMVVPIDYTAETKQKTMQTISMAILFNAKVLLYKQAGIDSSYQNKIDLNTQFVKRYLTEHDVTFEEAHQHKATVDFDKDFILFSKEVGADLIIILTTKDKELKDFVLGPVEQKVINNLDEIPVMCVHPLQNMYKTERLASLVNIQF